MEIHPSHLNIASRSRYHNYHRLQEGYRRAKLTPAKTAHKIFDTSFTETRTIFPGAFRGLTNHVIRSPTYPLQNSLKADSFQSLLDPDYGSSHRPIPPYFAQNHTNKRKRNGMVSRKTDLASDEFWRTVKVRLKPDKKQAKMLRLWFWAKRLYYNTTVKYLNQNPNHSLSALRTQVNNELMADFPDVTKVPSEVRANGTIAAFRALDSNKAKTDKNPNYRFKLQFQSLRRLDITPTEVITFDALGSRGQGTFKGFTDAPARIGRTRADFTANFGGTHKSKLGEVKAVDSKRMVDELLSINAAAHSSSIHWEKRTNKFYLLIKRPVTRPPDTVPVKNRNVLALDPGARKFNSVYRPDGTTIHLLSGAESYIEKMAKKAAALRSKTDLSHNHIQWHKYRGQMLRTFAKLRNWTQNAHYHSIKTLFEHGDFIILPVFETSRMVKRAERIFGNSTARQLYTWSHYSFSQRLWSKVETTPNKQMVFSLEPGTSKTCDNCGCFHKSLGGSKTFKCRYCFYEADRDEHGARGNLLAAYGAANDVGWNGVDFTEDNCWPGGWWWKARPFTQVTHWP